MLCLDHYSDTVSEEQENRQYQTAPEPEAAPPSTPAPSSSADTAKPTDEQPKTPDLPTTKAVTQDDSKERLKDPYSHTDHTEGPWFRNAESRQYRMFTRFAALSAVAAFGALGAAISMALRYRPAITVQPTPTPLDVISTQLLGASFALLLCLLFLGKFIRGTLFPDPQNRQLSQWFAVMYSLEEFAKLLVWSFIAGFSERLVPDFIRSLSERFARETNDKDTPKGA
jgi:hypothetical protein